MVTEGAIHITLWLNFWGHPEKLVLWNFSKYGWFQNSCNSIKYKKLKSKVHAAILSKILNKKLRFMRGHWSKWADVTFYAVNKFYNARSNFQMIKWWIWSQFNFPNQRNIYRISALAYVSPRIWPHSPSDLKLCCFSRVLYTVWVIPLNTIIIVSASSAQFQVFTVRKLLWGTLTWGWHVSEVYCMKGLKYHCEPEGC